eukprot:Opistho-2@75476
MDRKRKSIAAGPPLQSPSGVREDSRIFVHVIEAKNVPRKKKKNGPVTTFVVVSIGGKSAKSPTVKTPTAPSWDYECEFFNLHPYFESLVISVFHHGRFRNTLLAEAVIPRESLKADECEQQDWYEMAPKIGHTGDMPRVRIKYTFMKETILPLNEYETLLGLLQSPDLESVTALSSSSSNMVEVSKTLIKIMEGTDSAVRFLKNVTSHEINSTSDPNVIFRSNSIAAKSVDAYMKLVGIAYLQKVLKIPLKKIFADQRSCEVDEAKLGADAKPGDVNRNVTVLLSHVSKLTTAIFESSDDCPMPLRIVFHHIQGEAVRHFPSSDVIRYTSVTAFIFLRFFCPAILAPKKFGILDLDPPDAKKKRTLLLVSKTLQNLANLAGFGWKEEGMPIEVMNAFLAENKEKMKEFVQLISSSENIIDMDADGSKTKRLRRTLSRRSERPISMGLMDLPKIDLERELSCIFRHLWRTRGELQKYVQQHGRSQALLHVVDELERRHIAANVLASQPNAPTSSSSSSQPPHGRTRSFSRSSHHGSPRPHTPSTSSTSKKTEEKQTLVSSTGQETPDVLSPIVDRHSSAPTHSNKANGGVGGDGDGNDEDYAITKAAAVAAAQFAASVQRHDTRSGSYLIAAKSAESMLHTDARTSSQASLADIAGVGGNDVAVTRGTSSMSASGAVGLGIGADDGASGRTLGASASSATVMNVIAMGTLNKGTSRDHLLSTGL